MIDASHTGENGFVVRIMITAPDLPKTTPWERAILWVGSNPERINRICNWGSYVCNVLVIAYLILWFWVLHGIVRHTLSPTLGQDFFLSMGWAPIMGVQLLFFAARYASLSLTAKAVEQLSTSAHMSFFHGVQACVKDAMDAYLTDQQTPEPPKGPTLQ